MKKVLIDPGHGGRDPGAKGRKGTKESETTLAVARLVAEKLAPVVQVKLTRETDVALGPDENGDLAARARMSNEWGADYFISIHCNSANDPAAHGTETFCFKRGGEGEKLARAIQSKCLQWLNLADRGVKTADYYVLRKTECPAVLVELAFISNTEEETLLATPAFREKCAQAVAEGMVDFLGIQLVPPAPVEPESVRIQVGGVVISGVIINDRAFAPVRALAEALGKRVEWDEATRTVRVL